MDDSKRKLLYIFIAVLLTLGYVLFVYFYYQKLGFLVNTLAMIPIIVVALFFGMKMGAIYGPMISLYITLMRVIYKDPNFTFTTAMIAAIFIGLIFILAGFKPIGKGLILGTFFSILNFVIIGETLPKRIGLSKGKTFFWALGSIVFRYALMGIPLIAAIKYQEIDIAASACGLFIIQVMILLDRAILSIRTKKTI